MPTSSYDPVDDLRIEFERLAHRADTRLLRLEQKGLTGTAAYKSAMRMISSYKAGGTRFRVSLKGLTKAQVASRLNKVRTFLNEKTSTVSGRQELASGASKTIKERYGLDLDPDQLGTIFDGVLWQKLNTMFDSKTAAKILGTIQKHKGSLKAAFKELAEQKIYIDKEDKAKISGTIGAFVRYHKIDLNVLYENSPGE